MDINIKDLLKNYNSNDYARLINNAIKNVSDSGGGKVIIPEGEYLATTIYLLDNVTLYLEEGACLKLYPDLKAFINHNDSRDDSIKRPTWENCDYNGLPSKFFIYAKDTMNISIAGKGKIDGNEEIFYGNVTKWHIEGSFYPRIPLIFFENCKNVLLESITLTRSAFWTVHLVGCRKVLVDNVTILNNLKLTNCDGIDPDRSKDVVIRNTKITCADDCVVLKATSATEKYGACEHIHVSNCAFISTSAAIKIGTETCGDFNDILFENINIIDSNRGISLMLRDKGQIRNATFRNINMNLRLFSKVHWWGSDEGIAITAIPRKDEIGSISNISFENININSENGILIYGTNQNIRNIKIQHVSLTMNKKTMYPHKYLDLRPSSLGENGIIDQSFYALTINNAYSVELDDVEFINNTDYISQLVNIQESKYIHFKDVQNL